MCTGKPLSLYVYISTLRYSMGIFELLSYTFRSSLPSPFKSIFWPVGIITKYIHPENPKRTTQLLLHRVIKQYWPSFNFNKTPLSSLSRSLDEQKTPSERRFIILYIYIVKYVVCKYSNGIQHVQKTLILKQKSLFSRPPNTHTHTHNSSYRFKLANLADNILHDTPSMCHSFWSTVSGIKVVNVDRCQGWFYLCLRFCLT